MEATNDYLKGKIVRWTPGNGPAMDLRVKYVSEARESDDYAIIVLETLEGVEMISFRHGVGEYADGDFFNSYYVRLVCRLGEGEPA